MICNFRDWNHFDSSWNDFIFFFTGTGGIPFIQSREQQQRQRWAWNAACSSTCSSSKDGEYKIYKYVFICEQYKWIFVFSSNSFAFDICGKFRWVCIKIKWFQNKCVNHIDEQCNPLNPFAFIFSGYAFIIRYLLFVILVYLDLDCLIGRRALTAAISIDFECASWKSITLIRLSK